MQAPAAAPNPEEIDLDDDDDDDGGRDDVDDADDVVNGDQDDAAVPVYEPVNIKSLADPDDAAGDAEDALFAPTDMNFNRLIQQQPQQ